MKKMMLLLLSLLLAASLYTVGYAQETMLTLSDGKGEAGDTVYLAVQLNQPVTADAIGISYSYDPAALEALPGSCTWSYPGTLQDFDRSNAGVWAVSEAREIKNSVCVLAFRIKEGIGLEKTTVSCTLILKHGEEAVGTYTAEASVGVSCEHVYGDWEDQGNPGGHVQTCQFCKSIQIQSHTWEQTGMEQTDRPNWMMITYTCRVCGGTKSQEEYVQTEPTAPQPTDPQPTAPQQTEPVPTRPEMPTETIPVRPENPTIPTESYPGSVTPPTEPLPTRAPDSWEDRPTQPTGPKEETENTRPAENRTEKENKAPQTSTQPEPEPSESVPTEAPTEPPKPKQEEAPSGKTAVPLAAAVILLLGAGAWYWTKKKK